MNDLVLTNELNDALLRKDGASFWKCWRSKFEKENMSMELDGCVDAAVIAEKFAAYFTSCYSHNSVNQSEALRDEYIKLRTKYSGLPCSKASFDTELVSKIVMGLKRGKAADIDVVLKRLTSRSFVLTNHNNSSALTYLLHTKVGTLSLINCIYLSSSYATYLGDRDYIMRMLYKNCY